MAPFPIPEYTCFKRWQSEYLHVPIGEILEQPGVMHLIQL